MRSLFVLAVLAFLFVPGTAPGGDFESSGYLGMNVSYRDEPARGEGRMTIETVYPGSPAAAAGLVKGDVLARVNGTTFRFPDWDATMESGGPFTWVAAGDRVRLGLLRGGEALEIEVVAVAPPPEVVAARRRVQSQRLLQKGDSILVRLARQGTTLAVERPPAGARGEDGEASLRVSSPGLPELDARALSLYLSTSRLRTLFTNLEPGGSLRLKLGIHPGTEDPSIEVLKP